MDTNTGDTMQTTTSTFEIDFAYKDGALTLMVEGRGVFDREGDLIEEDDYRITEAFFIGSDYQRDTTRFEITKDGDNVVDLSAWARTGEKDTVLCYQQIKKIRNMATDSLIADYDSDSCGYAQPEHFRDYYASIL